MQFKTLFNRLSLRDKPFVFEKPSLTLQEPKEDCDINHIVQLYCGINPQFNPLLNQPFFESQDLAGLPSDLLSAYETIDDINNRFASLPSRLREEVGNSPVNMLQWISNPSNHERGVQIGLFAKPVISGSQTSDDSLASSEHASLNNNAATE